MNYGNNNCFRLLDCERQEREKDALAHAFTAVERGEKILLFFLQEEKEVLLGGGGEIHIEAPTNSTFYYVLQTSHAAMQHTDRCFFLFFYFFLPPPNSYILSVYIPFVYLFKENGWADHRIRTRKHASTT